MHNGDSTQVACVRGGLGNRRSKDGCSRTAISGGGGLINLAHMLMGMESGAQSQVEDGRAAGHPQGARTDLQPPVGALTLAETAEFIMCALDDRTRLRLFFEFCRGADEAGAAALALVTTEPALTGLRRFDALLAAAAEHLASRFGAPGPRWAEHADRFLTTPWWVSPLPSARIQAQLWTPAAFRRRGIYLDRADLGQDGITPRGD